MPACRHDLFSFCGCCALAWAFFLRAPPLPPPPLGLLVPVGPCELQLNAEIDRLRQDLHKARNTTLEMKEQLADAEVCSSHLQFPFACSERS